jgi:hypothetical protein
MVRMPYRDRLSRATVAARLDHLGNESAFFFSNPLPEIRDPGARLQFEHDGELCLNPGLWLASGQRRATRPVDFDHYDDSG